MKNLVNLLGLGFSFINEQLGNIILVEPVLDVYYKIHIYDGNERTINTQSFNTMTEAMDWVNQMDLMYNTEKKVFLEHVKGEKNSMIELNIYTNNVYKERPTVYRG